MGILNVTSIAKPICVVWICMYMNLKGVYNKAAPDCIIWAPMDSLYENWPYSNQLWNKNKCESLKYRWAGQHPIRLLCFPPFLQDFWPSLCWKKPKNVSHVLMLIFDGKNQMKSWAFRVVGLVGWLTSYFLLDLKWDFFTYFPTVWPSFFLCIKCKKHVL